MYNVIIRGGDWPHPKTARRGMEYNGLANIIMHIKARREVGIHIDPAYIQKQAEMMIIYLEARALENPAWNAVSKVQWHHIIAEQENKPLL